MRWLDFTISGVANANTRRGRDRSRARAATVLAVLLGCIVLGAQAPPSDTQDPTVDSEMIEEPDDALPIDEVPPPPPAEREVAPASNEATDESSEDATRDVTVPAVSSDPAAEELEEAPPQDASLTFAPDALRFDDQRTGGTSFEGRVTLATDGKELVLGRMELRGKAASAFTPKSTCEGMTVVENGGCTQSFVFSPKVEGEHTATLVVFDAQGGELGSLQLSGVGISSGMTVTPPSLDFSPPKPDRQQVTLEGTGTAPVMARNVRIEGDKGFASTGGSCLFLPLRNGQRCSFPVSYGATSGSAAASARLIVEHDTPGGRSEVPLTWTRPLLALLDSNVPAVHFGDINLAQSGSAEVVISNRGDGPSEAIKAGLQREGSPFAIVQNSCGPPLQPGASCSIVLRFAPRAEGAFSDRLIVGDTALRLLLLEVDGRGVRLALE